MAQLPEAETVGGSINMEMILIKGGGIDSLPLMESHEGTLANIVKQRKLIVGIPPPPFFFLSKHIG